MKIISVNINGSIIEFINCNWTGYEYIYVNGEVVSKKFSWFGTNHIFEVEENGEWVEYVLRTRFDLNGFSANITRDGVRIIHGGKGDIHLLPSGIKSSLYHENDLVGGF